MGSIRKKQMDDKTVIYSRVFDIAALAMKAMLYEVSCFPSPGLVSPVSQGSHKDMDYYTFIDSSTVIYKYILLFAQNGFDEEDPKIIFANIRKIGIRCEEDMLKETKGVNTHKGMVFLIGVCCAAFAKVIYEGGDFLKVRVVIKDMVDGICESELRQVNETEKKLTHGEALYNKYGVKGIRGEVEQGLPIVFDYSLNYYKTMEELDTKDRLVRTLIGIMQYCEDTTILYRHSMAVLKEVQNRAKKIACLSIENFKKEVLYMDREFTSRNISPGGSADLLSITVFVYLMEKYMRGMNL